MSSADLSKVIVLTGNIGSGKSSAAGMLANLGAAVVSADVLAREVVAPGSAALKEIASEFGQNVLTPGGELDRRRLAEIVFHDSEKLQKLEAITHPKIRELAVARLTAALAAGKSPVVYDCPLFFEAGLDNEEFGPVLLIAAPDELCLSRVMERDAMTREQAEARLREQFSMDEKRERADIVIENTGSLDELRAAIGSIYESLQELTVH